ncbi:hypothetical protein [Pseudoalteromonas sp. B160]|uniref:hypothetical protein n=1 Tax=Pseudoalteromonas sp. B160 TaxID=630414 RepID=UPI00301E2B39
MYKLFILVFCLAMVGCASTSSSYDGIEGSSFENAVVFPNAKSSFDGIPMENQWLQEKYPNFKKVSQSMLSNGNDVYDAITIETSNGETKVVYFKMTSWFGM